MSPLLLLLAALDGAAFVIIGAAGGHGVINDASLQRLFDTASDYHAVHALALLAVSAAARSVGRWAFAAAGLMLAGTVLFSGSLYLHAVNGTPPLPMATPLGGILLILGWAALAVGAALALRRN